MPFRLMEPALTGISREEFLHDLARVLPRLLGFSAPDSQVLSECVA